MTLDPNDLNLHSPVSTFDDLHGSGGPSDTTDPNDPNSWPNADDTYTDDTYTDDTSTDDTSWDDYDDTAPADGDPVPADAPASAVDVDGDGQLTVIGDPEEDSQYWFQQAENGWCGPASVTQIIAESTGATDLTSLEYEVVAKAQELGFLTYDEGGQFDGWSGMSTEDITSLLQAFDVPAAEGTGTISDLADALNNGEDIIVSVDSGLIWTAEGDLGPQTSSGTADHALVVTGIDEEQGIVYMNDPGRPEGDMISVSLDSFEEAWSHGGNTMIVAATEPEVDPTYDPTTDPTYDPTVPYDPTYGWPTEWPTDNEEIYNTIINLDAHIHTTIILPIVLSLPSFE